MYKKHYIYIHRNIINNEVFYVGQGTLYRGRYDRAYSHKSRNKWWINYVSKYGDPIVEIIICDLDKNDVDELEIFLIKEYGRRDLNEGSLVNLTNGGDGCERSEILNIEQSIRMSGEKHPMYGKKHSEEWCINNSNAQKGKILSDETKRKMSSVKKGTKRSDVTKEKISKSRIGMKNPMYGKTGEDNPFSKLTWGKVGEIRNMYSMGEYTIVYISKLFNVSTTTINNIVKNKTWIVE